MTIPPHERIRPAGTLGAFAWCSIGGGGFCVAAAMAFALPAIAPWSQAQTQSEDDAIVRLPPWIVEAPAQGALPPSITHGVTIVGGEESAFHPYTSLRGALGTLPGLVLQDSFGGFDPPRITVRGSGLQSAPVTRGLILRVDGLPLNLADGSFNSAFLEPALASFFATRRVSADSAVATTALGGSLELGLRRETNNGRILATAGSFGFLRGLASAGYADEHTSIWAGFTHTRSDGFRQNQEQDRSVLAATINHRLSAGLSVNFNLFAATPHLSVPGPLTQIAALEDPESILPVVAMDKPRRETDVVRLGIDVDWRGDNSAMRAAFGIQQTDDYFRQLRANGTSDSSSSDINLLLEGRREFNANDLRAGMHLSSGSQSLVRMENNLGEDGPVFADSRLRAENIVIWLEDTWFISDSLALKAGTTLGHSERDADPSTGAPAATPKGDVSATDFAPRINLTYSIRPELAVFAGWSRAFEAPTFNDLLVRTGTPANLGLRFNSLESQQADTFEVGIRGGSDRIQFEVTAYHADWHHELLRLADENGLPLGTRNAGSTTHRGIESSIRWRILQEKQTLDLILSHTWSEATFDDDLVFKSNRLAGLPKHAGGGEIQFADRRGPYFAIGGAWIGGETFADHANRLGYDGHFILNARCGWRDPRGWTLYLEAGNLFDKSYIASTAGVLDIARNPPATTIFLPGTPRTFNGGIEWRW